MDTVVRASAVAAVLALLLGIVLSVIGSKIKPARPLAQGFHNPGLAMELAQSAAEVKLILSDSEDNRTALRWAQAVDFFFIASYWLLFTLSAVLLAQRQFPMAKWLAAAATVFAAGAAVADVWEDLYILKILDDPTVQTLIDHCRTAALIKWNLIFLAMILLSTLFFGRGIWYLAPGVVVC